MLFNSTQFLLFFPSVLLVYFAAPQRVRWILLLAASYYFYMCWRPEYVLLLLASTLVDYYAGLAMAARPDRRSRRPFLVMSLAANLGTLFLFKYFNFLNESVREALGHFNIFYGVPAFDGLLPIGISFYTFQTMSYSIDVYLDRCPVERHLGIFALYVSYFPQLVAGPIERSENLIPQLKAEHRFSYDRLADGMRLMFWGFFKKVVVADRLAALVEPAYGSPGSATPFHLALATYAFAFQIYCDFSGYSDIAIGAARAMGVELMENFRRPYFSASIAEFWKRWHISLSTWFRDYVYIPLGGSRVPATIFCRNILTVFIVSGIWHGANWTFLAWGALHGVYLLAEHFSPLLRPTSPGDGGLKRAARVLFTFHLVLFGWIFFRARSLSDATFIIGALATQAARLLLHPLYEAPAIATEAAAYFSSSGILITFAGVALLLGAEYFQERGPVRHWIGARPAWFRWLVYAAGFLTVVHLGALNSHEFIYFAF